MNTAGKHSVDLFAGRYEFSSQMICQKSGQPLGPSHFAREVLQVKYKHGSLLWSLNYKIQQPRLNNK
jgi:hypothetical protein